MLATATAALCIGALWNGYPIVYSDTAEYISGYQSMNRTPFYGFLVTGLAWTGSLWPVIVVHGAIVAWLVYRYASLYWIDVSAGRYLLMVTALTALTGLPWVIGYLMTDIFAAVLVLSVFLLGFYHRDLGGVEKGFLLLLAAFSCAVHLSNVAIAAALVLLIVILRRWARSSLLPALALLLACLGLATANQINHGIPTLSVAGYAFPLARFAEDGHLGKYLADHCPQSNYRMCDHAERFPLSSQKFLWSSDSPLHQLGSWGGYREEGSRLVRQVVLAYPGPVSASSLALTLKQLGNFDAGPYSSRLESPHPTQAMEQNFPEEISAYRNSRQNKGQLKLSRLRVIHRLVIIGSVAIILNLLIIALATRRYSDGLLMGFLLLSMIAAAAVTGPGSTTADRYMARLVWLLPFALMLQLLAPPVTKPRTS